MGGSAYVPDTLKNNEPYAMCFVFAPGIDEISQFSDQPGACLITLDDVEYTLYTELDMSLTVWYRTNKGSTRRCIYI